MCPSPDSNPQHDSEPRGSADSLRTGSVAPGSRPSLGIVIVSWNVRDLLKACLISLETQLGPEDRVVVVDNASVDGTVEMLRGEHPSVILIANADNRGFTSGNNQGLDALGVLDGTGTDLAAPSPPELTMILNPDTELTEGAISTLINTLMQHPGTGAVGPALVYGDGSPQPSRRRFPSLLTGLVESTPAAWHLPEAWVSRRYRMEDQALAAGPVDWVTGAAILFRTEALAEAQGFDEGFFMYSEELDLCKRLHDAGWQIRFCPQAVIVHHEGKSSEQVVAMRHREFHRSRVRYFRKHHGRLAGAMVRIGILKLFELEMLLEAGKWLLGHRRDLRRARVAAYWSVLRDGLGPSKRARRDSMGTRKA
jgi:N-acetylglucosaminyl-diphospho-decaprenol L-rhamnosyltransferase